MPRQQKQPEYLECRECGAELPHGQRNPKTGRLFRSDMQFCPWGPELVTPVMQSIRSEHGSIERRDLRDQKRLAEARRDKYDHDIRARGTNPVLKPEHIDRESCKDKFHNRRDPARRPVLAFNDDVYADVRPVAPTFSDRVLSFASRVGNALRGGRSGYATTLAVQSGDEDLIALAIAQHVDQARLNVTVEQERAQVELLSKQADAMELARHLPDITKAYTFPTPDALRRGIADPRPAPTGATCPNCLQPDTDHLPGCAVASGEDPDAVTIPGT